MYPFFASFPPFGARRGYTEQKTVSTFDRTSLVLYLHQIRGTGDGINLGLTMKTSYGEQLCRGLLARWFPEEKVVYNYRPEWLKNPETGRRLELDIYYPDLKLAVEFNGSQHKLFLQKRKDYFKFQQCLKLGIVLLVVYHPMDIYKCKGLVRRHTGVKTPSGREDEAFLWEMKAYSPTEDGSSKWYVEAKSKSEEAEKAKKEAWRARKLQRKKIEA